MSQTTTCKKCIEVGFVGAKDHADVASTVTLEMGESARQCLHIFLHQHADNPKAIKDFADGIDVNWSNLLAEEPGVKETP